MMRKQPILLSLVGACALTLTLALSGCGAPEPDATETEATETEATVEEETTEDEATTEEVTVPSALENVTDIARSMATSDKVTSDGFDALPTEESDNAEALETEAIETGSEDDSKVGSEYTILHDGGMQMTIPSNWLLTQDEDGWVMLTKDQGVVGYMYSYPKPSGTHYDVEGLAKSVPGDAASRGWTNVTVLGYNTGYSENNTLCGAWVLYRGVYNGNEIAHYIHFIESKSYINIIEFMGVTRDFDNHINEIAGAVDSICFEPGEII